MRSSRRKAADADAKPPQEDCPNKKFQKVADIADSTSIAVVSTKSISVIKSISCEAAIGLILREKSPILCRQFADRGRGNRQRRKVQFLREKSPIRQRNAAYATLPLMQGCHRGATESP